MIEPRDGVLQTLFADRVFRIPHYQHSYSWHKRQRDDLFNDLMKLAGACGDQHLLWPMTFSSATIDSLNWN
jgi:hypothetical protein